MDQKSTLKLLSDFQSIYPEELAFCRRCQELVETHPNFYDRQLKIGHLTASAWIVHPDKAQILLIHHLKLSRWLQPGGHIEPEDRDVLNAALREAREETGLTDFNLLSEGIYDIDIHMIPARGDMPAHEHYDLRFILEAAHPEKIQKSEEVKGIKWFEKGALKAQIDNVSILRMLEKMG